VSYILWRPVSKKGLTVAKLFAGTLHLAFELIKKFVISLLNFYYYLISIKYIDQCNSYHIIQKLINWFFNLTVLVLHHSCIWPIVYPASCFIVHAISTYENDQMENNKVVIKINLLYSCLSSYRTVSLPKYWWEMQSYSCRRP